ncbi:MAG: hypothetical protein WB493_03730 [Anaeromyxobacteraceae bacterium]
MAIRHCIIAIVFAAVAAPALARSPVPIIDFRDQAFVTVGDKVLTPPQVRDAIIRGAASLGWTLAPAGDQKFLATLVVRNKHTVVTEITYAADKFSVIYMSSNNMKYGIDNGVPVIHPFYNDWARSLVGAIRAELTKY